MLSPALLRVWPAPEGRRTVERTSLRAIVVGGANEPLEDRLRRDLEDVGVVVQRIDERGAPPDVVLAVVESGNVSARLLAAKAVAAAAPLVAILPSDDAGLAMRAIALGARACLPADASVDRLRLVFAPLTRRPLRATEEARPVAGRRWPATLLMVLATVAWWFGIVAAGAALARGFHGCFVS
jgi:hypothetical protein